MRQALDELRIDINTSMIDINTSIDEGVALHAELEAIAGLLHDAVEEWGDDPSLWQSPPVGPVNRSPSNLEEKPLHTKERENLLKMVIEMAVKGYSYNPSAAKSDVPGEIVEDLAECGFEITDDTVRKYLRLGAELLLRAKT